MDDARIKTRRLAAPTATFRWSFRPITEQIWENEWQGLAMQLEVASPGVPLHWGHRGHCEIGGAAAGVTLIQQDLSTMDLEQGVKRQSAFSTTEKFFTDGWGGSYPMDMLPRAAGAAICDFQVKEDVALCLFAEKPGLTRARLEMFADENLIHYTDRPFFPLTEKARLPERKLLVYRHPQKLRRMGSNSKCRSRPRRNCRGANLRKNMRGCHVTTCCIERLLWRIWTVWHSSV